MSYQTEVQLRSNEFGIGAIVFEPSRKVVRDRTSIEIPCSDACILPLLCVYAPFILSECLADGAVLGSNSAVCIAIWDFRPLWTAICFSMHANALYLFCGGSDDDVVSCSEIWRNLIHSIGSADLPLASAFLRSLP